MRHYQAILPWSVLLASIGGAQAKLDLNSSSNMVVYWGQNSFNGKGDKAQQPLSHYCDDDDIDVIPMAFNMMVNGPGGAPEIDFAVSSKDCDVFEGTKLKNCPKVGKDIEACQKKDKTILLSIGGATYSEGGFQSEEDAKDGAKLMWETFGPKQEGSKALRPFGDVALDGFDFDFEANVQHMAPFANELRSLMEADKSKQKFYLTAAPQCPYPDQADKEILNGPVYIDAIWVQFYNNFCGVNNFNADPASSKYNFDEWDNWAKTVSKNPDVKVIVGVPAFTTAASTGYIPASQLDEVIQYSKKFESFGGVMLWDATQAYGNDGFIKDVRKSLGPADDDSGSSSPDTASTSAPAPTSTDSTKTNPNPNPTTKTETPTSTKTKTSPSSSAPDSSLSSASSESATVSPKEPEATTTAETKPTTTASETKPTNTASETKPINTASETKPTTITTQAKPTTAPTTTAPPAPSTTEAKPVKSTTAEPETSSTTVPEPAPAPTTTSTPEDADESDDDDSQSDKDDGSQDDDDDYDYLSNVLGNDIIGLLGGLRQANKVAGGVTHGLTKNLRRAQRSRI